MIAYGEMNLSESEFENTTPLYFNTRLAGLRRLQFEQEKSQWERIRWQTVILLNPHIKKPVKATDLIKFQWEKVQNSFEWIEQNKAIFDKLTLN